ncbi:MAG: TMEM165/GDT1 family protein [Candidatus Omnitrophica bacterium]|nr:TMEM165/GDT1 family protein [Candidatus Omnitrophota bacterium]
MVHGQNKALTSTHMLAFLASLGFVLLAEMGDKTQLLAMAFAARYRADKVLLAVFLATVANHAIAVLTGHFLSKVIPFEIISVAAALSFIGFGIWTLHGDHLEGEDKRPSKFGPVATVAIAFFIAEMGDKTQLATVSLAVKYDNMLQVLIGTTIGMVAADAIGIIAGIIMKKHIPERAIKYASASVFIMFGLSGIYSAISSW